MKIDLVTIVMSMTFVFCVSEVHGGEIERLPVGVVLDKPSAEPAQVRLSCRVIEISRTTLRLQKLHADQDRVAPDRRDEESWQVVADSEQVDQVIRAILANRGKLLTESTLSVIDNQPMQFQSGGKVPILPSAKTISEATEFVTFGTTINATPVFQTDGSMKLNVDLEIADLDRTLTATKDGRTIPEVRKRSMVAEVVLKPNTTLVIGGMRQTRVESRRSGSFFARKVENIPNEIETVLVVRPTITTAQAKKAN